MYKQIFGNEIFVALLAMKLQHYLVSIRQGSERSLRVRKLIGKSKLVLFIASGDKTFMNIKNLEELSSGWIEICGEFKVIHNNLLKMAL